MPGFFASLERLAKRVLRFAQDDIFGVEATMPLLAWAEMFHVEQFWCGGGSRSFALRKDHIFQLEAMMPLLAWAELFHVEHFERRRQGGIA
jgi:hypothetical protein